MCDNQAIVDRLAAQLADTPNDRLREVMIALVRSLHSFVEDVALTQQEWGMGIEFLTATGKMCDEHRQEFILLSDVLGISMLVDQIDHRSELSTESTVLGPFYRDNSPARSFGEAIFERPSGVPTYYHGRVLAVDGAPIGGATVDVWQNGDDMLYAAQDRTAPPNNLRGLFTTDAGGHYAFVGVRPVDYPVPTDGPVGTLLRATARHPWRAAHIHAIVRADGYRPVTTHLFDDASQYLDTDVVFGVKTSLVKHFANRGTHASLPPAIRAGGDWYSVEHDFVLENTDDGR